MAWDAIESVEVTWNDRKYTPQYTLQYTLLVYNQSLLYTVYYPIYSQPVQNKDLGANKMCKHSNIPKLEAE